MIIRRFVEAIRAQHWTTVLVELMVVIGGIFLGLRVDDWNEERKLRAEDRLYIQRLREDVLAMIDSNAEGLGTWQVDASLSAAQSLQDCVLEDEDERSFEFALIAHQVIQRLILERTTYDEMVASGALARLEDQALKRSISRFFARAETQINGRLMGSE